MYIKMITGYYFENEHEEEVLYVPEVFELTAVARSSEDDEIDPFLRETGKPHVHINDDIIFLDCNPIHLENIVLGIKTDTDFRRKILDGEVELIEISERYVSELKRIYDLRQEKREMARHFPLEEEYLPKALDLFFYIDSKLEAELS
ncbi:hypothetical protein J4429_03540 [Candidatus Pacearchaeota archaeon]|nr:hypothetical protein [Candidatus Pacearchaeota archaeon]